MKKSLILFLLFGLLISNFLIFIKAENSAIPPNLPGGITTDKISNANQFIENMTDSEIRNQYLKNEWTKILEKYPVGRFFLRINDLFKAINPLFKIFIGINYSLSWEFFLIFFLWIASVIILYDTITGFIPNTPGAAFLIGLIITTLSAQLGIFRFILNLIPPTAFKNTWIIYAGIIGGILIVYLHHEIMKSIKAYFKEQQKKEDEERREQKEKLIEEKSDVIMKKYK